MNRRPHRCGSRYRAWSQQLQNDSPGIPQVIVIFDENMPMKCHFRHSSTRPSPNRHDACKPDKASAHAAELCPFTSWLKFTGVLFSMAVYKLS
ncbi:hypothetical protein CRG95_16645 [Escherichia sp. E4208]|nr:hypothetical protein CRT22_06920 [Escherichia sp. E5028]TGB68747.1 hypothetical protein CQB02_03330 [Escherichia coli]TGB71128.1 hypothetical protein CRG96_04140 [Escherichia sp. E4930]TGB77266.1 hypothetical protein CRI67_08735 [Escherichia sp. E4702]TGB82955.1 hypothetical protein CRG95_16645 [Escherichia sp. E4208]TGB91624.1 hypothetical protein CRI64_16025 [Escherichia sp. E2748]TGC01746.1 hypothetical protein CRI63_15610 [Escherichia sp. E2661]TGC19285.1 hypothetical protein CRU79_03